jgi:hypothetical protein
MYKYIVLLLLIITPVCSWANVGEKLLLDKLKELVVSINNVQNKVLRHDSTLDDLDDLFLLYTEDFEYIHEVYGGTYTRDHLYKNYAIRIEEGRYKGVSDRYKIISMIPGHNAVAVERQQTHEGVTANHLAVFEFRGDKVSKIIEYWK